MALSNEEEKDIQRLLNKLVNVYTPSNIKKDQYYEANTKIKPLSNSRREKRDALETASAWGKIIVNTKSSRVVMDTIDTKNNDKLMRLIKDARLIQRSNEAQKDCLIYGTAYWMVGYGDTSKGEPRILVTAESPYTTIGEDNVRTGRLNNLLQVSYDSDGNIQSGVYYTDDYVIYLSISSAQLSVSNYAITPINTYNFIVHEVSREVNGLRVVPAVRMAIDVRGGNREGKSLISKTTRYFIDAINRAYENVEHLNDFYAFPKRYISGINPEDYINEDGTPNNAAVDGMLSMLWLVARQGGDIDGSAPSNPNVGQLDSSSPEAYLSVIRQFASEIIREHGIPEYYLNAGSEIPTAAEAMEASEHPLNLQVAQLQQEFANAYSDLLRIMLLADGEEIPEDFSDYEVVWRDTSTISLAGRVDALAKLIAAGSISPYSPIILTFVPWTPMQRRQLEEYQKQGSEIEARSSLATAIREAGASLISSATTTSNIESVNTVTGE